MSYRTIITLLMPLWAALLLPMPGHAEMGGALMPVSPPVAAAPPNVPEGVADNGLLVLTLRYNHPHPTLEHELREALDNAEKSKPGGSYKVISLVPSGAASVQTQGGLDEASANLDRLVQKMKDLGISEDRIGTDTEFSGDVSYQEIDIYIK